MARACYAARCKVCANNPSMVHRTIAVRLWQQQGYAGVCRVCGFALLFWYPPGFPG